MLRHRVLTPSLRTATLRRTTALATACAAACATVIVTAVTGTGTADAAAPCPGGAAPARLCLLYTSDAADE